MQLDALRRKIDEIDAALLPLLRKRLACAREVARYKKARGLPVLNRAREEAILADLAARSGADADAICALYEAIFTVSRDLQEALMAEEDPC